MIYLMSIISGQLKLKPVVLESFLYRCIVKSLMLPYEAQRENAWTPTKWRLHGGKIKVAKNGFVDAVYSPSCVNVWFSIRTIYLCKMIR